MRKLDAVKTHPMIGKTFKSLTKTEVTEVEEFIAKHQNDSDEKFMHEVNRFKLNQPKTKGWSAQMLVLSCLVDTVGNLRKRKQR